MYLLLSSAQNGKGSHKSNYAQIGSPLYLHLVLVRCFVILLHPVWWIVSLDSCLCFCLQGRCFCRSGFSRLGIDLFCKRVRWFLSRDPLFCRLLGGRSFFFFFRIFFVLNVHQNTPHFTCIINNTKNKNPKPYRPLLNSPSTYSHESHLFPINTRHIDCGAFYLSLLNNDRTIRTCDQKFVLGWNQSPLAYSFMAHWKNTEEAREERSQGYRLLGSQVHQWITLINLNVDENWQFLTWNILNKHVSIGLH